MTSYSSVARKKKKNRRRHTLSTILVQNTTVGLPIPTTRISTGGGRFRRFAKWWLVRIACDRAGKASFRSYVRSVYRPTKPDTDREHVLGACSRFPPLSFRPLGEETRRRGLLLRTSFFSFFFRWHSFFFSSATKVRFDSFPADSTSSSSPDRFLPSFHVCDPPLPTERRNERTNVVPSATPSRPIPSLSPPAANAVVGRVDLTAVLTSTSSVGRSVRSGIIGSANRSWATTSRPC